MERKLIAGETPMPHLDWPALWNNLVQFGAPSSVTHPISLLEKVVRPVAVYLVLVLALRTVGKRMLAQLNPFDLVVLLTLSNTVQNAIIGNDTSLVGRAGRRGGAAGRQRGAGAPLLSRAVDAAAGHCRAGHQPDRGRPAQRARAPAAPHQCRRAHRQGARARVRLARRGRERRALSQRHDVFPGREPDRETLRHDELLRRLDALGAEVAALRR